MKDAALARVRPTRGWGLEQWRAYVKYWAALRARNNAAQHPRFAATFAWSVAQREWHRLHPLAARGTAAGSCAGCGQPMTAPSLSGWPDAPEVHDPSCLARYAVRWRFAATLGLTAMGLEAPALTPEAEMIVALAPEPAELAKRRA